MKLSLRVVAILFSFVTIVESTTTVGAQPAVVSDDLSMTRRVVDLVNRERSKAGLFPLKWNDQLASAATSYAQEMAARNFFSHNSPDGTTPVERARRAGYEAYGWGGLYVGENLAKGYSSPEGAMQGWMASEGHRNNVLHANYRETGVGIATAPGGATIWVQEFGSRPKVLPVFINNEDSTTAVCDVTLSVCSETVSSWGSLEDIAAMMVSNYPDFSGATWESFSAIKPWKIRNEPGLQRVYVRLRDKKGMVTESQDEIFLSGQQALGVAQAVDTQPVLSVNQQKPEFKLGFKILAGLIPEHVGSPLENEHSQGNGDSLQRTTGGLMVWRKADNWTAFTNGAWTWINGPFGLQDRANDQRLPWE